MSMVKPQKLRQGQGVCMLLFGFPGVGKTPLIGSSEVKTLIVRPPTDHTTSIRSPHNVQELVVPDWAGMYEAKRYAQQEGWKEFEWVWLDSLSVFQDFGLRDCLQDAVIRKPSRSVKKGGETIPELGADKGEYGTNMDRITAWIQDMCGFAAEGKFNFGIVCHPEEWFNPVTDETVLAPWIRGKGMIMKICGYMNIIAYLQEVQRDGKDPQLQLLTNAPGFYGKDQYGAFPKLKSGRRGIIAPTMAKVNDAIAAARVGSGTSSPSQAAPKKKAAKPAVKKIKKVRKG